MGTKYPGLGVMIRALFGGDESARAFLAVKGKKIESIALENEGRLDPENCLIIGLEGGFRLRLHDEGQSCCESRYMHTDDDLPYFIGSTLENIELRDGPNEEREYGEEKESQFLIVTTSKGQFTVVNYNEHNGYYGGFSLEARLIDGEGHEIEAKAERVE